MKFNPFESRLCRDARNTIGHGFVRALREKDIRFFTTAARKFDLDALPNAVNSYVRNRQTGLENLLREIAKAAPVTDPFFETAGRIWNLSFYFEAHEWLEDRWRITSGPQKKPLQALIMAATVYELMSYQRRGPAEKLAARTIGLVKDTRAFFPEPFQPDLLIRSLSCPDRPAPVFVI